VPTRGRVVALALLLLIAALYVEPVGRHLRLDRQVASQRALVERLERERTGLERRREQLTSRAGLIVAARRCGYVFPGERAFVIEDVPPDARARCA
jgi:cell division protein FtsB